jgi:phosphatidylglycerophosphate synthase
VAGEVEAVAAPMMIQPTQPHQPSYAEVLGRLASAQKSNRGAAGYTRWINRPLGRRVAALAYLRGLVPNQLSMANATLTAAAFVLIATVRPSTTTSIATALVLLCGYIFDSADGQLARLSGGGSPAGEWLDHVLDAAKCTAVHCVVAIAWFRFYDLKHEALLLLPLAYCVVNSSFFFGIMLAEQLRRVARANARAGAGTQALVLDAPPASHAAPVLRSLIVLPNDYGVLCIVLAALFDSTVFVPSYAFLLLANTLFLLAGSVRWYREMSRLGASTRASSG